MKAICLCIALLSCCAGYPQATGSFTVYFDFNKYDLTSAARTQLDSFLHASKQDLPTFLINLDGHCDSIGSDKYNNQLSMNRVLAVKKYLLKNGIRPVAIVHAKAHGKQNPLHENKTAEERQLNRRVEISIRKIVETSLPGIVSLKEKIADSATTTGTNIVLKNINFVGGMHQFINESYPALQELLEEMRSYPELIIQVQGHICCEEYMGDGMDGETGIYNLSEARAKAVRDYLVENNIAANRVSYKGFGHSSPIYPYPEKTEEERIQNRRVEIKIVKK